MAPTNKCLSVGSPTFHTPALAPVTNPEPCLVVQVAASTSEAGSAAGSANAVFADLNYAFNRHEAQVRSYRAQRDQELDDAVDD